MSGNLPSVPGANTYLYLLHNPKRKGDTNVLSTPPIAESTWVTASVVSLGTTPISGGSQPQSNIPMISQVIGERYFTPVVEQKVCRERRMIFETPAGLCS